MDATDGPVGIGTLTDREITSMCESGRLIVEGFDKNNVKQACYELSASSIFYDDILTSAGRRKDLRDGKSGPDILIKPHQLAVLITEEELELPSDILGRVLSKGQLFSLGLVPVNTYADPGFCGHLGIVLLNASSNYLRIRPGDAIAKIEFSRLTAPVERPYQGQHGYQTGIWPVTTDKILSEAEIRADPRIGSAREELEHSFGRDFGSLVHRVYSVERRFALGMVAYLTTILLLLSLAVAREERLPLMLTIVAGVLTNAFTGVAAWVATNIRRK
jgi:dCTP deaminase